MPAVAAITAPPVVVLRIEPEVIFEIARFVVVAFVVVEFPVMTRLPLIVEDAEERKPPESVERPVTPTVEENVAAPVTISVPVVVAPPRIVRPVPFVAPPIVEDALMITPMVEVGAKYAVAPEPFTSQLLPKICDGVA